jgi:hypothetical protein
MDEHKNALRLKGQELLATIKDLADAASHRADGQSALNYAAVEEEVRLRYIHDRLCELLEGFEAIIDG